MKIIPEHWMELNLHLHALAALFWEEGLQYSFSVRLHMAQILT
jgi:hypothetical protein